MCIFTLFTRGKGPPRIQNGSLLRLELTDEWKGRGGVTMKLRERSGNAQGVMVSKGEQKGSGGEQSGGCLVTEAEGP
jgi:hypothetical protein